MLPSSTRLSGPLRIAVLAAAYIGLARLGLALDAVGGFATLVWAPTGISLAAVIVWGRGVLPGVALGAFAANLWNGAPVPVAAGIAAGNTLEALAGEALLCRLARLRPALDRVQDAIALTILGAAAAPVASATVGVGSLVLGGIVPVEGAARTFGAWWIGDAMGALLVTPSLLVIAGRTPSARPAWRGRPRREAMQSAEAVALALVVSATAVGIFGGIFAAAAPLLEHPYLVFPILIWAALRFGPIGACPAVLAVAVVATAGTILGAGPFAQPSIHRSLLSLHTFLSVVGVTFLVLASAAEERRRAVLVRDAFLSVASHELNTPLTTLKLTAQVLEREASGDRSRALILRQVNRLATLVNRLLDVSTLSAGALVLERRPVDLHAVIDDIRERLAAEVGGAGCTLEVDCPEGPLTGSWDALRIDQLLSNLIGNAVKHARGRIRVIVRPKGAAVVVAVEDEGPGIPPEDQDRIFDRFERTAAPGIAGLGLGLYIAREIARAHGGTLAVESPPGGGARFVLELPAGEPHPTGLRP